MAKATLTLPDGTTVVIEGSAEEIARVMSLHSAGIQAPPKHNPPATQPKKPKSGPKKSSSSAVGPKQRVFELKGIGFFDEKKSIADIQKKLEEQGHIYAQSSLSPALVRLVRSKDLRRVKEDNVWMYANP